MLERVRSWYGSRSPRQRIALGAVGLLTGTVALALLGLPLFGGGSSASALVAAGLALAGAALLAAGTVSLGTAGSGRSV